MGRSASTSCSSSALVNGLISMLRPRPFFGSRTASQGFRGDVAALDGDSEDVPKYVHDAADRVRREPLVVVKFLDEALYVGRGDRADPSVLEGGQDVPAQCRLVAVARLRFEIDPCAVPLLRDRGEARLAVARADVFVATDLRRLLCQPLARLGLVLEDALDLVSGTGAVRVGIPGGQTVSTFTTLPSSSLRLFSYFLM